ncbi:MAG: alginate lyase family protein [Bacteroidota bacterium]
MFFFPSIALGQLTFADHSRLKDRWYLENRIKTISDDDLFSSLDLTLVGLSSVRSALETTDLQHAYEEWAKYWREKKQPKYLTQNYHLLIDTDLLKTYDEIRSYADVNPEERDSILRAADRLVRHEIRTWGDVVLDFGQVVNFDKEIGKSGKYGFHYWIWARPLTTAYVLTGDQRYLEEFDNLFNRWHEQRNDITRSIAELDVVYYELGLGIRNRVFIEHCFLPYEGRTSRTHERMLKTILGAARWLYELEKWEGYRAGNWQIVGSYMLAQIAVVFPEFKESAEWLHMGLQRLEEHMEQDFFEDGGHSERAPRNYTLLTYLSYRNLYYLLKAYKVREDLEGRIRESMGRTIDWWIAMLAPTGEVPAINDSHRGLFPVGILQDGAEFYRKREVYGVLKNLLNAAVTDPAPLPLFTSRHMPSSGFTVMRSDWTRDALYMNINYGKFAGFHTHNDLLDFEVYACGKALAVDAGIGLTYDDPLYIPWYQSSKAHNMVVVNDANLVRKDIEGENIVWSSTNGLDFFAGEHRGYAVLGVSHRRQIVFVKPRYWVVMDQLKCEEDGSTLSWYFHSPTELIPSDLGFRSSASPGVVVLPANTSLIARTGKGFAASTDDLTPGKSQEINWIAFDQASSAGATRQFPILLYPFKNEVPSIFFSKVSSEHYMLKTSEFTDDLYFPVHRYDDQEVSTDAVFLLVHHGSQRQVTFSLVQGTYLRCKGKEIWSSKERASVDGVVSDIK